MLSQYSGLYAKTCAMRGKLLTYDDFSYLANSLSVADFIDRLNEKETYKEAVEEALDFGASRVAIERGIVWSLYRDYSELFSFMTTWNERKYFDVFFLRYEIGTLKRFLRRVYDHRKLSNVIPNYDNFFSKHAKIDVEKLSGCTTLNEVIDCLNETEFHDVLSRINRDTATLFDYETQLDLHGYIKTKYYQDKYLNKGARESQERINGSDADLHNIMWIYRAKTFYQIDNEHIFAYLIPISYRLNKEHIKALIGAPNDEEFAGVLADTAYKNTFSTLAVGALEQDFNKYMCGLYHEERKKHPFSLQSALSHIFFKGNEIRNLTTLIECVRYKLPSETTLTKLNLHGLRAGDKHD